jgi:hypothetical protein
MHCGVQRVSYLYRSLAKYLPAWVRILRGKSLEMAERSHILSPQIIDPSGSIFSKATVCLAFSRSLAYITSELHTHALRTLQACTTCMHFGHYKRVTHACTSDITSVYHMHALRTLQARYTRMHLGHYKRVTHARTSDSNARASSASVCHKQSTSP